LTPIRFSIWTIGHSTRPIDEFIRILQSHGIGQLVDVRSIPRSRHNPQFNLENLPGSLQAAGIQYRHMPGLGGLRHARRDSINTGWRNASFRGYADYMQVPQFRDALQQLIELAAQSQAAIMCAEAVPWRCHRSLIADALQVRGITVLNILSMAEAKPHVLTSFAKVDGVEVTYPGPDGPETGNLKLKFDGT
jgi:uncharacterized protein (DUF488 family)